MTHILKITNGAKLLAASLLTIPEQFTTPPEILRAAYLHEALTLDVPTNLTKEQEAEYVVKETEVQVTEAQRKLLQTSIEANAKRLLPTVHAASLLTSLGFEQ